MISFKDTSHADKGYGINGGNPLESFKEDLERLMEIYELQLAKTMTGETVIVKRGAYNSNEGKEVGWFFGR